MTTTSDTVTEQAELSRLLMEEKRRNDELARELTEANAEIDQLKAIIEACEPPHDYEALQKDNDRLEAERDRLRASVGALLADAMETNRWLKGLVRHMTTPEEPPQTAPPPAPGEDVSGEAYQKRLATLRELSELSEELGLDDDLGWTTKDSTE